MNIYSDPLQALIQKNKLKLEQHHNRMLFRYPNTPQVQDSQQFQQFFSKSANKSSSIDKSYLSAVPTRKSTKQSFFIPKSAIPPSYLDLQAQTIYQCEDLQQSVLQENCHTQQLLTTENNLDTQISIQSPLIEQLKKEKEIMQQQHQFVVTQLSREIENNKRIALKNEQDLKQQIQNYQNELKTQQQYQNKILQLENHLQQVIMENNELRVKQQEQNKWLFELQEQFEMLQHKTQETRQKLQDTKLFSNQLCQITQYQLNKQTPPLDFLVFMNNQSKQLQFDQQQENELKTKKLQIRQQNYHLNPFPITKETFALIYQLQIENTLMINQILNEIKNNVDKYSQQYITEVGLHLM